MLHFNCAFIVVAGNGSWGKHLELPEALKIAHVKAEEKNINYCITMLLFERHTTKETMQNVLNCYCVDGMGSIQQCTGLSASDETDIKSLLGYAHYNNKNMIKANKPAKVKG